MRLGEGAAPAIAVFPVLLRDRASPAAARHMQDAILDGLRRGGFTVVEPRATAVAVRDVQRCGESSCYVRVARETGATYLIRTTVLPERRDYVTTIELIAGRDGEVEATSTETCEICGLHEVSSVMAGQAATLAAKLESLLVGVAGLSIDSHPSGASVKIDDRVVGQTPVVVELEPGRKMVRVDKPGFVSVEREVLMVDGTQSNANFDLRPTERRAVDDPRARRWAWASTALGTGFLAGGTTLLALHGKEQINCAEEDMDAENDCQWVYVTAGPGGALVAVGAALLTLGITLLVLTRDRARLRNRTAARSWPRGSLRGILGKGLR